MNTKEKNISVHDFFPYYATKSNTDFYQSIMNKKEIADIIKKEEIPTKKGEFFKHQTILSRYMSSYTLNESILLFHEMGTGKTGAAVAIAEKIRKENSTIDKCFIFAKSKQLLLNFYKELSTKYSTLTKSQIKKFYKIKTNDPENNLKVMNGFMSAFLKVIPDVKDGKQTRIVVDRYIDEYKELKKRFSNSVIIIDEVHHLRSADTDIVDSEKIYDKFFTLLHSVENCKIVLLSGTPMVNSPTEIIDILNLIIPLKKVQDIKTNNLYYVKSDSELSKVKVISYNNITNKVTLDDERNVSVNNLYSTELKTSDYFTVDTKKGISVFNTNSAQTLKDKTKGYVSILNATKTNIKKQFTQTITGKQYDKITSFDFKSDMNFDLIPLSSLQDKIYGNEITRYNDIKTDEKKRINTNLQSISKFVFPDGTFDIKPDSEYININDDNTYTFKSEFKKILLKGTEELKNTKDKQQQIIKNISKLSTQFAYIIKTIMKCYEEKKCMLIYSRIINGIGGIQMLSLLLEFAFGYQKATTKNVKQKGKRFWLFTSHKVLSNPSTNTSLIKTFNSRDNVFGEHIQIIIASDAASEGYSFSHIQYEILMTPWYNFAKIEQIIMRGIRERSHDILIEELEKKNIPWDRTVMVSLLAGVDNDNNSIELDMYKRSIIKDVEIKKVYRVLKEGSFDCLMFKDRNKPIQNMNKSRECEYQECEYKCDIENDCDDKNCNGNDLSTYNIYYTDIKNKFDDFPLEKSIIQLFLKHYSNEPTIDKLLQFINYFFDKNINKKKLDKLKSNIEQITGLTFSEDIEVKQSIHDVNSRTLNEDIINIILHNKTINLSILDEKKQQILQNIINKKIIVEGNRLIQKNNMIEVVETINVVSKINVTFYTQTFISIIEKLLQQKKNYTYSELYNIMVDQKKICKSQFELLKNLLYIIEKNILINNRHYLRESNNVYYIVNSIESNLSDYRLSYYDSNVINEKKNIISIAQFKDNYLSEEKSIKNTQETIMKYYTETYIKFVLTDIVNYIEEYNKLKSNMNMLSKDMQIKLIQNNINKYGYQLDNNSTSMVQFFFKNNIRKYNKKIILNIYFKYMTYEDKKWRNSTLDERIEYINIIRNQEQKIMNDEKITWYSLFDSTNLIDSKNKIKYSIVRKTDGKKKKNNIGNDKRSKNSGRDCSTIAVKDLGKLVTDKNIIKDKDNLCTHLYIKSIIDGNHIIKPSIFNTIKEQQILLDPEILETNNYTSYKFYIHDESKILGNVELKTSNNKKDRNVIITNITFNNKIIITDEKKNTITNKLFNRIQNSYNKLNTTDTDTDILWTSSNKCIFNNMTYEINYVTKIQNIIMEKELGIEILSKIKHITDKNNIVCYTNNKNLQTKLKILRFQEKRTLF